MGPDPEARERGAASVRPAADLDTELRSSLTVVMNNLFLAQARLEQARDGPVREASAFLDEAISGAERIRRLSRRE